MEKDKLALLEIISRIEGELQNPRGTESIVLQRNLNRSQKNLWKR